MWRPTATRATSFHPRDPRRRFLLNLSAHAKHSSVRNLTLAVAFVVSAAACGTTTVTESPDAAVADAGPTYAAPSTLTALTSAHIGSDSSLPDFQKTTADIDLGGGPFASAILVVDLVSTCFPFDLWKTNPPPAGQTYPATCDAFDRNFETALVDPNAPATAPGIELVHAITPFGGPLHIERDITDVVNGLQAAPKQRLEITIPTYSDGAGKISGSNGGWSVSARIELTPGPAPANVLAVLPLVYDDQTKGGVTRSFPFTLPAGTTSARIEYLATGHGQGAQDAACIGPADEFCKRMHTLNADGVPFLAQQTLWRDDCDKLCTITSGGPFGAYCAENPCGGTGSVVAPRANWCPGSETPPLVFTPAQLTTAGAHAVDLLINQIADGGSWRVSLKVFALGN